MAWRDALSERFPVSADELRELTNEPVPNHLKRWWFCLGGTPAYLFIIQIVTGILLAFYYQASTATAYDSIDYITHQTAYGWYIRSLHKWAATLMVAAVVLHQLRVFFTGAYRKPRELNWMIGMCLLCLTLLTGFTGYSLAFEQLSYWGATVAANLADSIPILGPIGKRVLLAGDEFNPQTLSRLYVLHAAVLPAAMIGLLAIHIALIRLLGISELGQADSEESNPKTHFNFFPDHLLTELMIGLGLMVLLSALAIVLPAEVGPAANPLVTPEIIKPEWYFYPVFRWLKIFPQTVAVLSTGFIVFLMFVWPFIDGALRRWRHGTEISVAVGVLAVISILVLTLWEAAVAH